jgi:hypothetical protein
MAPRCPNPYIEPSVAVATYGLALVAISLNAPVRIAPSHRARAYPHLLEMPPYALLLHSVPAHTPNGISGHLCSKHVHRWISCALARSVLQSSTGSGTPRRP